MASCLSSCFPVGVENIIMAIGADPTVLDVIFRNACFSHENVVGSRQVEEKFSIFLRATELFHFFISKESFHRFNDISPDLEAFETDGRPDGSTDISLFEPYFFSIMEMVFPTIFPAVPRHPPWERAMTPFGS